MNIRRSKASFSIIAGKINAKIKAASQALEQLDYTDASITADEFYDYMTGETPTSDQTTLEDVLESEFLMVHEVVEMSELKKMNVPINQRTVMNFYPKVYEAHSTAMDWS